MSASSANRSRFVFSLVPLTLALVFGSPLAWNAVKGMGGTSERVFSGSDCNAPDLRVIAPATMSRQSTRRVEAVITNVATIPCTIQLEFSAHYFKVHERPPASVVVPAGEKVSRVWVIEPEREGDHTVVVSAGSTVRESAIDVRHIFGVRAEYAQLIVGVFGALFAGVNVPWLVSLVRERKVKSSGPPPTRRAWKRSAR